MSKDIKATEVVVSYYNRGRLGFNPNDVHKNTVNAFEGGINPSKLDDAVSHEFPPPNDSE